MVAHVGCAPPRTPVVSRTLAYWARAVRACASLWWFGSVEASVGEFWLYWPGFARSCATASSALVVAGLDRWGRGRHGMSVPSWLVCHFCLARGIFVVFAMLSPRRKKRICSTQSCAFMTGLHFLEAIWKG